MVLFDLVGVSTYYGNYTVYLSNGNGTFTASPAHGNFGPSMVITGDFNGDGKLDLAGYVGSNSVGVLLGNGNGTFGPPAPYLVGNRPLDLTAGDFNGDGKQDLAVINTQDGTMSVLLANPNGLFGTTFLSATTYPLGNGPTDIQTGDFNHDGKLDLVVTNTNDNDVAVFLGNGNGTFTPGVTFAAGPATHRN